jgi:ribosomal protein L11 methyltransferase
MTTFSALTTTDGQEAAEALAAALEKMDPAPVGLGVFEIEDGSDRWEVGAYFEERPNDVLLAVLGAAFGAADFALSELPETDWVAKVKRDLHPVEAGRFFVHGSHDADKVPAGRVALMIEATVAFGTGHHGTTLGCLQALDRLVADGAVFRNVADIGCGTAVLAMAAAKVLPDARVLASDIDAVAVAVAEANLPVNGLQGRIACITAPGFDHPAIAAAAPFDLIFANILKGPLVELAPGMASHCAAGGVVILSGLLAVQAESVTAAYVAAGFAPQLRQDLGEWSTLVLRRS